MKPWIPSLTVEEDSFRRHCFHFPLSYFLLPTAYCLLPTSYFLLPTAYFLLPTAYFLLPTSYCLLPTAYCLLPTSYCLLPTAYCLLPTAYESSRLLLRLSSRGRLGVLRRMLLLRRLWDNAPTRILQFSQQAFRRA